MICKISGDFVYDKSELISSPHLFTTRLGGVSKGVYESLNTSFTVGDDRENVLENLRRIAEKVGFSLEDIVCSMQVHSAKCKKVGRSDIGTGVSRPVFDEPVDAMMTDEDGVLLLVRSADCTPILLEDSRTGAVAAIHSGWKGTLQNIAKETVNAMEREYGTKPEDINAAIGACISKESFEVGDEVAELFENAGYAEFVDRISYEKSHIDIRAICAYQLENVGVKNIDISNECTKINNKKYFSHRAQGAKRGLLAAVIGKKKTEETK